MANYRISTSDGVFEIEKTSAAVDSDAVRMYLADAKNEVLTRIDKAIAELKKNRRFIRSLQDKDVPVEIPF